MARPPVDQALWQPWIDHVCAAVDVDPALVDVSALHALSGRVAGTFSRPMAPVAAHLYGVALGAGVAPEDAVAAIRAATDQAAATAGGASDRPAATPAPDSTADRSGSRSGERPGSSEGAVS